VTDTITTVELCDLTGASFRFIDFWTREGVITPAVEARGSGSRRHYRRADVGWIRVAWEISLSLGGDSGVLGIPRRWITLLRDHYDEGAAILAPGIELTWPVAVGA
jgi:hypothetical protein